MKACVKYTTRSIKLSINIHTIPPIEPALYVYYDDIATHLFFRKLRTPDTADIHIGIYNIILQ